MAETGCLKDGHFQNLEVVGNIIVAQDDFTLTSTTGTSKPEFVLNQDKPGQEPAGPIINLKNSSGGGSDDGIGQKGDTMGTITFTGQDEGGDSHEFSKIISTSANASAGTEQGKLDFQVACGGTSTPVVSIEGGTTGTSSIVTIPGIIRSTALYPSGLTPDLASHGTGAGITTTLTTQSLFDINTIRIAGMILTTIQIDLTGFTLTTAGTDPTIADRIIGKADTAACHLLTFSDTTHGQIVRIEMYCNETPTSGTTGSPTSGSADNADIDLLMGDTAKSGSALVGTTQLLTAGGNWGAPSAGVLVVAGVTSAGGGYASSILPIASASGSLTEGKLLALAAGNIGDGTAYTAGKFIIKLWGVPVGYIS